MTIFSNTGSFARRAAVAAWSSLGACWRSRVRSTALILAVALFANSVNQDSAAQSRARLTPSRPEVTVTKSQGALAIGGVAGTVAVVGIATYLIIQRAHTVKGCVTDDPDHLLLHTEDGRTYVLLGATTNIKADTVIKVRGSRKKKISGLTDQPTFIVEKVNKVYGPCSVPGANP